MPPARLLLLVFSTALLLGGCGSSEESEPTATATTPAAPPGASAQSCEGSVRGTSDLRVTGVDCDVGRVVVAAWTRKAACSPTGVAARSSCSVHGGYRCLAAATERGVAVSCARPGMSIAFLSKPE